MKNYTPHATLRELTKGQSIRKGLILLLTIYALWLEGKAFAVGSWVAMANTTNDNFQICLLLPDGTVLAEGSNNNGTMWYSLSPDSNGHYVNSQWAPRASSSWGHQTGSTAVLDNGNVFVAGGENGNGTNKVEIYNTSGNYWTTAVNPTYFGDIYDGNAMLMPDGQVLIEPQHASSGYGNDTFLFNPNNNSFSQTTGAPLQGIAEATWVKLPNNNTLVIDSDNSDYGGTTSEQYDPYTETWIDPQGGVPNIWPNFSDTLTNGSYIVSEMGPGFMLPNGNAIFFGGNGVTAVYNPNTAVWSQSATVPQGLAQWDAPGAMMVNGKILVAVSPAGNPFVSPNAVGPTSFFEYDYTANGGQGGFTQAPNAPPGYSQLSGRAGVLFMLDLPDGTVLLSGLGNRCWIYQPDGSPLAAGKPTIDGVTWNADGTLHLTGTLFNGISGGASYGDDSQMDSNWPLLRFTDSSGNVTYGSTYNWSAIGGVQTGSEVVSTDAHLSPEVDLVSGGTYSLQVVANGIASNPVSFQGPVWVDFVNYVSFIQFGTFDFPYATIGQGVSAVSSGGTIAIDAGSQPSDGAVSAPYTISTPMNIISVYGPSTIGN